MVSRQGVPIFRVDVLCPLTGGEGDTYSFLVWNALMLVLTLAWKFLIYMISFQPVGRFSSNLRETSVGQALELIRFWCPWPHFQDQQIQMVSNLHTLYFLFSSAKCKLGFQILWSRLLRYSTWNVKPSIPKKKKKKKKKEKISLICCLLISLNYNIERD